MAKIIITIEEEDLDNKLRKLVAERQEKGLLTVERIEISDYIVTPPTKKGKEPRKDPRPEDFVMAVKNIVCHAAQQNGKVKRTIENGRVSNYCFWLDDKAWCEVMDELLTKHRNLIEAALEGKYKADSVNLLAPYIGENIDSGLFQKKRIRKSDLFQSFDAYYEKSMPSVHTRLSLNPKSKEIIDLCDMTYKIAKKKEK